MRATTVQMIAVGFLGCVFAVVAWQLFRLKKRVDAYRQTLERKVPPWLERISNVVLAIVGGVLGVVVAYRYMIPWILAQHR
jgi:purine-cytosine permease-like protein